MIKYDTHGLKEIPIRHHAQFSQFVIAQEIVRKYIQNNNCIIYGGMAVDFALRASGGDHIYDDDELPDYDFFAPDNVKAAHELVNILSKKIGTQSDGRNFNIYAARAIYVRTMKVAVGSNNWVADITYIPPALFEQIPTMTHDGMRYVHPHFQFNDLHSSLAFPYDAAPREVVFARWAKDIARFNKLYAAYPIKTQMNISPELVVTNIPREIVNHTVLQGYAAYGAYYAQIKPYLNDDNSIIDARNISVTAQGNIAVYTPHAIVDAIMHRNIAKLSWFRSNIDETTIREYGPFLDLIDHSVHAQMSHKSIMRIYLTIGRYISYNSISLRANMHVRVVSIHALLKFFISSYLRAEYFDKEHELAHEYAAYYTSCFAMIAASRAAPAPIRALFDPSVTTFGEPSPTPSDLLGIYYDFLRASTRDGEQHPFNGTEIISLPRTLQPDVDTFDYDSCPFTRISGEEIKRGKL
jgi:hypothetical protein